MGREEREVVPNDVDDRTGVNGARGGVGKGEMRLDRRENGELNYQERVAVIWIEKVKSVGPCTLDGVERGRSCAEDRVILADMTNIGVFERVDKAASNPPIIIISLDIRTLGNGNGNRGIVVGVVRHTLGRRDSCRWWSVSDKIHQKILTYLYLCARCSEIQRRLRMEKSKRGRASSSLYTPGPLGLNIDLLLWYHFTH